MRYAHRWISVLVTIGSTMLLIACGSESATPADGPTAPEGPELKIESGADNVAQLSTVSDVEFGQTYNALAVSTNYVYVCVPAMGLQVFRLNGPQSLTVVVQKGTFADGSGCREISIAPDGMVFAAGLAKLGGSWIASLADGSATENGLLPVSSTVTVKSVLIEDLIATQSHVFAVFGDGGLRIFERGSNGTLTAVGSLTTGFDKALGVDVYGTDKLVIGNGPAGVAVVDISNTANPSIIKTFKTFGTGRRVKVIGDIAYVAAVAGGVSVHDLKKQNPYPPMGSWATHASSMDIDVTQGGLAFVANKEDLSILDVSDPTNVKLVGSEYIKTPTGAPPQVTSVRAGHYGGYDIAYVAEWSVLGAYAFVPGKDAPDIHLSKLKLNFGLVSLKKGKAILVHNFGNQPLEVSNIQVDSDRFTVDMTGKMMTVAPGKVDYIEIVFEPVDMSEVKAQLTLTTNDPDESTIVVPLKANSLDGIQVGAPFDGENGLETLFYTDVETGNDVSVIQTINNGATAVLLVYFATW